ncbi:MAG: hypothetical protein JWO08_3828 [Verrucomicrobiaceae bacterium]|nr:hypothetical protein [Verrucomicrobiaceae bacterium]
MGPTANRPRTRTGAWLVLAGTLIIGFIALISVLSARFDTGENYPAYSSLRADPLGTRALFESVAGLPGIKCVRQFDPLEKLQGAPRQTLLVCGMTPRSFATKDALDAKSLARFAAAGGRLVIALNPTAEMGHVNKAYKEAKEEVDQEDEDDEKAKGKPVGEGDPGKKTEKPKDEPKKDAKKKDGKKLPVKPHEETPSMAGLLKVSAKSREFFYMSKEGSPLVLEPDAPLAKGETPPWFSNVFLDDDPTQDWKAGWEKLFSTEKAAKSSDLEVEPQKNLEPVEPSPWHVIATKGKRNMVMERKLGAGSVVICTDRYFLSNEALWKGPSTAFLSWLLGNPSTVIFEETHLGASIGDQDGIMTLARRYRMHGLFLGGILLFALFIWRNAISLVPPNTDEDLGHWRADAVAGQSTASGLEGLLRRGISPSKLLTKSLDIWEETKAAAGTVPADRRAKARALLDTFKSQKHAAQAYGQIRDTLYPARPQPAAPLPSTIPPP